MVHRPTVTVVAMTCVLGLGAWLAYISIKRNLPPGVCCSLASLYSMLFIYHRLYDLSILILPLFYSASRLHTTSRPARWCHAWVVAAILLALNAPRGEFTAHSIYASSFGTAPAAGTAQRNVSHSLRHGRAYRRRFLGSSALSAAGGIASGIGWNDADARVGGMGRQRGRFPGRHKGILHLR